MTKSAKAILAGLIATAICLGILPKKQNPEIQNGDPIIEKPKTQTARGFHRIKQPLRRNPGQNPIQIAQIAFQSQDYETFNVILDELSETGNPQAKLLLARACLSEIPAIQDPERATALLSDLENIPGSIDPQELTALRSRAVEFSAAERTEELSQGKEAPLRIPVEETASEAFQGDATAAMILSAYYSQSIERPPDPQTALAYLHASAEMGNLQAAMDLARAYADGADIEKNQTQALTLLYTVKKNWRSQDSEVITQEFLEFSIAELEEASEPDQITEASRRATELTRQKP